VAQLLVAEMGRSCPQVRYFGTAFSIGFVLFPIRLELGNPCAKCRGGKEVDGGCLVK